jgi:hypothetical protein
VEVLYNDSEGIKRIAAAIRKCGERAWGQRVVLRHFEWKVYLDLAQKGEYDIVLGARISAVPWIPSPSSRSSRPTAASTLGRLEIG